MSGYNFYIHKDTYDVPTRIDVTAAFAMGVIRNIRYDSYERDFKASIANNTLRIRDENNRNDLGVRTYYSYFVNNTITYVDVYYNSAKLYTGYILKDTLKRTWAEGTYWTEFTIAHVMSSLASKYINFYTTELGAFEDLTKMVLTELPATRLLYTIDTLKDADGNTIIPPYSDSGESFSLTSTEFAGEYVAGSVDEDLLPDTGYIQIGRETTAYTDFYVTDSPYSEKKMIVFTVDRSSPYAGSREYWDLDTFMILSIDTAYIDFITDYNIDLASDDSAKSFYWAKYTEKMNYLQQADYDEAGNETTIPFVIGQQKVVSPPYYYMNSFWFNNVLEDDIVSGTVSPAVGYDIDVRPVWGNWFSSSGHTAYNFSYYFGIDVGPVKVWLQKQYVPSGSDTNISSWSDAGTTVIPSGGLVYTGDSGKPEAATAVFFPYVRWSVGLDNVYDFQFISKPVGGYHYILICYKNGSNYELRTYQVDVDYGGIPTTAEILGTDTLWDWCSDGTLLDTQVIGTDMPVLLRNVAGVSRVDADGKTCRTRTYYLDMELHEYQIIIEDGFRIPASDTYALPTFTDYTKDNYSVSASAEYGTNYAWKAFNDTDGDYWQNADSASPAFEQCQLNINFPAANDFDILPTFTGSSTDGYIISASSNSSNAWKAADDNDGTYWAHNTADIWQAAFPQVENAYEYTILADSTAYMTDWTFEGSNNGSDWTVLDTVASEDFSDGIKHTFPIANTEWYRYYRINITYSTGLINNPAKIYEIEIKCHVTGEVAYKYYILASATAHPRAWTFEGSDDGVTWHTLDTQTGQVFAEAYKTYTVSSPKEYKMLRLNITDSQADYVRIKEFDISVYDKAIQVFSENEIALTYQVNYDEIVPTSAVGILSYFSINDTQELRRVVRVPSAEIDIEDETALDILNVYRKLKLAIMWVDEDNVLQIKSLSKIFSDFDIDSATELERCNFEYAESEIYDYNNITIGDDSYIKTERVRTYYKLKIAELFATYQDKYTIKYYTDTFLPILSQVKFTDESGVTKYGVITGYNIINSSNDITAVEYSILSFDIVFIAPVIGAIDMSEVI